MRLLSTLFDTDIALTPDRCYCRPLTLSLGLYYLTLSGHRQGVPCLVAARRSRGGERYLVLTTCTISFLGCFVRWQKSFNMMKLGVFMFMFYSSSQSGVGGGTDNITRHK